MLGKVDKQRPPPFDDLSKMVALGNVYKSSTLYKNGVAEFWKACKRKNGVDCYNGMIVDGGVAIDGARGLFVRG